MRFARYWVSDSTGEILAVLEQEMPFDDATELCPCNPDGSPHPVTAFDLGLVEHFEPVGLQGEPVNCAGHLFQRLDHERGRGARAKPGTALPPIVDCPATLGGIRERVRQRGPGGLPAKARAWLTLMLPPADVAALGIARGLPVSALKALDAMRSGRDKSAPSKGTVLERRVPSGK